MATQLTRSNLVWQRALTTNSTDASFASLVPTKTAPVVSATGGVFVATGDTSPAVALPQGIEALFFGAGADNSTFSARLTGWKATRGLTAVIWMPVTIFEVSVTLSAMVGVAATDVLNTDRLADTITLATGYLSGDPTGVLVTSPTGDIAGNVSAAIRGYNYLQWSFKTGTSTNCNALWAIW